MTLVNLPSDYDPDQVAQAIEQLRVHLSEAIAAAAAGRSAPGGMTTGRVDRGVTVIACSSTPGTYTTPTDPRIAHASAVRRPPGRTDRERFRIEPGLLLRPWAIGPTDRYGVAVFNGGVVAGGTAQRWLTFGLVVVGIPHRLGRPPERLVGCWSSGQSGPTGQKVVVSGGTSSGTPVRAEIRFLPVLGVEPQDVQRNMKFLAGFHDGTGWVSDHAFDDAAGAAPGSTYWDCPGLPASLMAEMVTTEKHFSGVLLATCWGFGTWHSGFGYGSTSYLAVEEQTGAMRDPVQGTQEPMGGASVGRGGTLWAMPQTASSGSLQTLASSGLSLMLSAGTVDFMME